MAPLAPSVCWSQDRMESPLCVEVTSSLVRPWDPSGVDDMAMKLMLTCPFYVWGSTRRWACSNRDDQARTRWGWSEWRGGGSELGRFHPIKTWKAERFHAWGQSPFNSLPAKSWIAQSNQPKGIGQAVEVQLRPSEVCLSLPGSLLRLAWALSVINEAKMELRFTLRFQQWQQKLLKKSDTSDTDTST